MEIACTGHRGMVGQYLLQENVRPLFCDVRDKVEIEREITRTRPDVIIHLAAKSNTDFCEKKANEDKVIAVNVRGTYNVAEVAEKFNIPVVLLSSAQVFDGKGWWGTYKEHDKVNPLNMYGISKIAAEGLTAVFENLTVVRTSYLFDSARLDLHIELLQKGIQKDYPTFLRRSFTYVPFLVRDLLKYCQWIHDGPPDILHLGSCDSVSWFDFMRMVAKELGYDTSLVQPRRVEPKDTYVRRGYKLGLSTSLARSLGYPSYTCEDGVRQMVNDAK